MPTEEELIAYIDRLNLILRSEDALTSEDDLTYFQAMKDVMNVAGPGMIWSSTKAYNVGDIVSIAEVLYVCLIANTGLIPVAQPTYWDPIFTNGLNNKYKIKAYCRVKNVAGVLTITKSYNIAAVEVNATYNAYKFTYTNALQTNGIFLTGFYPSENGTMLFNGKIGQNDQKTYNYLMYQTQSSTAPYASSKITAANINAGNLEGVFIALDYTSTTY